MNYQQINQELGNMDIYLLDAVLKGRFFPSMRILDAGCGEGRNLHWFIKNNYDVWACDKNPGAIRMLRYVARSLNNNFDTNRFIVADIEDLPYPNEMFEAIICNAVLHFAENEEQFEKMWARLYSALHPEGILFIRLTSNFGLKENIRSAGHGKYYLPDGSLRFLLTQELLDSLLKRYPMTYLEPVKSVLVNNSRSMTTLLMQKAKLYTEA